MPPPPKQYVNSTTSSVVVTSTDRDIMYIGKKICGIMYIIALKGKKANPDYALFHH